MDRRGEKRHGLNGLDGRLLCQLGPDQHPRGIAYIMGRNSSRNARIVAVSRSCRAALALNSLHQLGELLINEVQLCGLLDFMNHIFIFLDTALYAVHGAPHSSLQRVRAMESLREAKKGIHSHPLEYYLSAFL